MGVGEEAVCGGEARNGPDEGAAREWLAFCGTGMVVTVF